MSDDLNRLGTMFSLVSQIKTMLATISGVGNVRIGLLKMEVDSKLSEIDYLLGWLTELKEPEQEKESVIG